MGPVQIQTDEKDEHGTLDRHSTVSTVLCIIATDAPFAISSYTSPDHTSPASDSLVPRTAQGRWMKATPPLL